VFVCARVFVSLDGEGLVSLNGQDLPLVLDIRTQTGPSLILSTLTKEKKEHAVHPSVLKLTTGF